MTNMPSVPRIMTRRSVLVTLGNSLLAGAGLVLAGCGGSKSKVPTSGIEDRFNACVTAKGKAEQALKACLERPAPTTSPVECKKVVSSLKLTADGTTIKPAEGTKGQTVEVFIKSPLEANTQQLLKDKLSTLVTDFTVTIGNDAEKIKATVEEVGTTKSGHMKFTITVQISDKAEAAKYPLKIVFKDTEAKDVEILNIDQENGFKVKEKPRGGGGGGRPGKIGCSKFAPAIQPAKAAAGECDPSK